MIIIPPIASAIHHVSHMFNAKFILIKLNTRSEKTPTVALTKGAIKEVVVIKVKSER